jgi:drug/metabolite transporter (DMT)-like permease
MRVSKEFSMPIGILAGLATCALWGLTFVAPRAVEPFSALDLTVARYGIFGFASLLLMGFKRFRPRGLSGRQVGIGLLLGGVGYLGYFISAAYAVRMAGAAIPPLVIGTMPVLLAVIANLRDRTLPLRRLTGPLLLIAVGVAIVNLAAFGEAASGARGELLIGLCAAITALLIWIAYGMANAAVLRAPDALDGLHWTGLQGLGAGIGSIFLLPFTSFETATAAGGLGTFLLWSLLMGLAGSWLATWFWVVASQRLPLALAAQLITAETLFGLTYGFIFEARWPSFSETAGSLLQMAGVLMAISLFTRKRRELAVR